MFTQSLAMKVALAIIAATIPMATTVLTPTIRASVSLKSREAGPLLSRAKRISSTMAARAQRIGVVWTLPTLLKQFVMGW